MSSHDVLVKDNDIDISGIMSALIRKWWLILLVAILSGILLFVGLSLTPSRYLSTADVLIESQASSAIQQIQEGNGRQLDTRLDERAVTTEVEVLSSDKIALEVIDQLELYKKEEFQEGFGDLKSLVAGVSSGSGDESNQSEDADQGLSQNELARIAALREFREKLTVYAIEKSQVISIEFWSNDPILARNVVNAITERYQTSKVNAAKENVEQAAGYVNPRIAELRTLIESERRAVAQFESDNQIFKTNNGSVGNPGLLVNQELSEASTELSRLRAERSAAQAKIASTRAALNSGSSLDVIPEVLQSTYIQNLRQQEVGIQAQISDLSTSLLPQHPQMKALQSQLNRYQGQIRKATQDIITSLENNVASTRNAEKKLAEEIDQLKNDQLKVNSLLVDLEGRNRNITALEGELQRLLSDSQQVRSRAEIQPAPAVVLSAASLPDEAYFPKVVPFTLAGMTAASLLTVLGIIAVSLITTVGAHHSVSSQSPRYEPESEPELANTSVSTDEPAFEQPTNSLDEVTQVMKGQAKAAPASSANEQPKIAGHTSQRADGAVAVRYATSVLSDMGHGRITVVSPGGDAGSKTAWILARLLSNSKHKTVLIDLSGGGASAKEMLGTKDVPGIFNLISGSVNIENAIFKDRLSRTHVLAAGQMFPGTNMPDMQTMSETIDIVADSYDFCVIDCGDADMSGIELASTDDSIIVVSTIDADSMDCQNLQKELKAEGYKNILQISPDSQDLKKEAMVRL